MCIVQEVQNNSSLGASGRYLVKMLSNRNGGKATKSPDFFLILLLFSVSSVEVFFELQGKKRCQEVIVLSVSF